MRRIIRIAAVVVFVLAAAIQFVRPARTNPVASPASAVAAHLTVPDDVAAVLERACRDCHSNETRWPWYSNVAPVSWFVIDHVDHGRSHFNYSTWSSYGRDEAVRLLDNACTLSQKRAMPLGSYLLMHSSARLSSRDVDLLCRWTDTARTEIQGEASSRMKPEAP